MKRFAQIIVLSALFVVIAQAAFAQTFSVQGVLRDPMGKTVDDGFYSMTFRLYEQATGGTAVWEETQSSVQVLHGVYNAELGTATSLTSVAFDTTYYLGLSIEGGQELEPRFKLTRAPAAMSVQGTDNVFPSRGNIGVGTTAPTAGLHIVADPTVTNDLLIEDQSGNPKLVVNDESHVGVGVAAPTATLHIKPATDADNNLLIEASNGDDKVVVTPDGKMGIGVDAPTAALHIQPAEDLSDNLLIQSANGDTQVVVTADGKMGVGVGNPQHPLAVNGNLRLHSGGAIVFDDGTSIASAEFGGSATAVTSPGNALITADANTTGEGEIQLITGATPRMVVTNDGNVGIGTTSPGAKLSVSELVQFQGDTSPQWATSGAGVEIGYDSDDAGGQATGRGVIQCVDRDAGENKSLRIGANDIEFLTGSTGAGTERMRIDTTGNVGIGLTNPSAKLHVHGQARFQPVRSSFYTLFDDDGGYPVIKPSYGNGGFLGTSGQYWASTYTHNIYRNNEYTFSDRAVKQNIRSVSGTGALDKVLRLNGVKYDINTATHPFFKDRALKQGEITKDQLGFVAQDLMKIVPEMVVLDEETGFYMIRNQEQLVAVLVEAIKELKAEKDAEIAELRSAISDLVERVEALENR